MSHVLHVAAVALAIAGFLVGLAASFYWWRGSQVEPRPVWGEREPVDPNLSQGGWIAGMLQAASESARLNRIAALLTAVAVVLSTASSVVGLLG